MSEKKYRLEDRKKIEDVYRIEFNWTNGDRNCWDNVKDVNMVDGYVWFDVNRDDRWNRVCVDISKVRFFEFMGKVEENKKK